MSDDGSYGVFVALVGLKTSLFLAPNNVSETSITVLRNEVSKYVFKSTDGAMFKIFQVI